MTTEDRPSRRATRRKKAEAQLRVDDEAERRSQAAQDLLVNWIRLAFERAKSLREPPNYEEPSSPVFAALLAPYQASQRLFARGRHTMDAQKEHWVDLIEQGDLPSWLSLVAEDHGVAKVYELHGSNREEGFSTLRRSAIKFVNELLVATDEFIDEIVRDNVVDFWTDIKSQSETFEVGTLVYWISAPPNMQPICLGKEIELRPVLSDWARSRFQDVDLAPPNHIALSVTVTRERSFRRTFSDADADLALRYALLGLQIVRPGSFHLGVKYLLKLTGRKFVKMSPQYSLLYRISPDVVWDTLSESEIDHLRAVGKSLSARPVKILADYESANNARDLALRSFIRSFDYRRGLDAVVDLAVVLEALFSDGHQEMTYKISLRTALLVGYPSAKAKLILDTVKEFYTLRSKIVHAKPGEVSRSIKDVVEKWRGGSENPETYRVDLRGAIRVGTELVGSVLRACLYLELVGINPFSAKFISSLDLTAFDPQSRSVLLEAARVK